MKEDSLGCMGAMIAHAAALSSSGTSPQTFVVVLQAPSEASLLALEASLLRDGIPHAAFREPDRHNQLMSIGINPVERRLVRRHLTGFSLLGKNPKGEDHELG